MSHLNKILIKNFTSFYTYTNVWNQTVQHSSPHSHHENYKELYDDDHYHPPLYKKIVLISNKMKQAISYSCSFLSPLNPVIDYINKHLHHHMKLAISRWLKHYEHAALEEHAFLLLYVHWTAACVIYKEKSLLPLSVGWQ